MAGKKGRSGGPREGAGRPPKPPETNIGDLGEIDPLEFLESVMRNPLAEDQLRVRAAITVAQYRHAKKADAGKKQQRAAAAGQISGGGRFGPAAPPKAHR